MSLYRAWLCQGWRAKLDLCGGQPLDHSHRPTADRTSPERESARFAGNGLCPGLRFRGRVQQLQAQRQECCALAVRQKTKVANTNKTTRQQVEEKSPQELVDRQGDQPLFVFVSRISPAKCDVVFGQSKEPVVGYGDPVSIGSEVA